MPECAKVYLPVQQFRISTLFWGGPKAPAFGDGETGKEDWGKGEGVRERGRKREGAGDYPTL